MAPERTPFLQRLRAGYVRSDEFVWLAVVPAVSALLAVDKVRRVVGFDQSLHLGVTVGSPSALETLWQFVSVPQRGLAVEPTGPPWLLVVTFVVQTALLGGYLGSVRRGLAGDDAAFVADSLAYLGPMAVWTGVPLLGFGAAAVLTSVAPDAADAVLVGAFAGYVAFGYLFYAAPFLVVLRGLGIADALRESLWLAVGGGPYLYYAVGYVAFTLVASLVGTAVVVNLRAVGVLVGLVAGSRLGLAATTTTMLFVADLDESAPALGRDDGGGPGTDPDRGDASVGESGWNAGDSRSDGGEPRGDGGGSGGSDREVGDGDGGREGDGDAEGDGDPTRRAR